MKSVSTLAQDAPSVGAAWLGRLVGAESATACWFAGLGVLTLCSWARWLATGSLRIDENYPSEGFGSLLFLALVSGWVLLVLAWVQFLKAPPAQPRRVAYGGLAIVALMLPLLSNDLYGLFAYSGLAARGHDVYTSTIDLPTSYWFTWIGERWRTNLFAYGPLALLSAGGPAVAGENHPLVAIFLLRLTWFVPLVAVMELSFRQLRDRPFFHAMVWLNPLVLIQGGGQLHLDILGLVAVTAGICAQLRGRRALGALGWALASLSKWNLGVCAPWFWLSGAETWAKRVRSAALMGVVVLGVAVAAYLPLWRGPETIAAPVRALRAQTLVPGGSIVDIVGGIGSALSALSNGRDKVFDANQPVVERVAREGAARAGIWRVAQLCMLGLSLVAALPLVRVVFQPASEAQLAAGTGAFIVIALTLASPKFQSWYLMSALPFFGLSCPPAWRRWWPWVIFFAVAQEFPLALPRNAVLFAPAVGISVFMTGVLFLWSFRERYFAVGSAMSSEGDA
jgi:hypothetical protein